MRRTGKAGLMAHGSRNALLMIFWMPLLSASALLLSPLIGSVGSQGAAAKTWNFDRDPVNQLPPGFLSERTGRGMRGNWYVTADATAPSKPNVLTQKSEDTTDYRFPVAIVGDSKYQDLKLSVRFKILSGNADQSAGLVFRYRNVDNYYLLRASAADKENQFRLYHIVEGRRTPVAGINLRIPRNEWRSMAVEVKDHQFRCYFDNQLQFETQDKTITVAGKIGVWTKADAVACFDDLTVQGLQ